MYLLLALLLSIFVLLKALRGAQLVNELYEHSDQSLIDHMINATIVRSWSNGALAILIVVAISKPDYLYQPILRGDEYWQLLTVHSLIILVLLVLAIAILGKYLTKASHKRKLTPLTEKLSLHKPGKRLRALLLAFTAAVNEELLFRAAIPLVFFMATNSFIIAVLASVCLFALAHISQGVGGVVSSALGGILLMSLFVASNNILAPMLLHFMVDLLGLIILPSLKDNPYLRKKFGYSQVKTPN